MLVNIKQLRNLPKAAPDAIIVFASGETNRWSNSARTSILLPAGTQAERPQSPRAGMLRFNEDIGLIEFYDGLTWLQTSPLVPTVSAGSYSRVNVDQYGRVISGSDFETRIASSSKNTIFEIFEDGTNNSAYATFILNNTRVLKVEGRNITVDSSTSADNTASYQNLFTNFSPLHFAQTIIASATSDYHKRVNGVSSIPISWNLLLLSKNDTLLSGATPPGHFSPSIGFYNPYSSSIGLITGSDKGIQIGNAYPFVSYGNSANRNIYFPVNINSNGISVSSNGTPGMRLEVPSVGRTLEMSISYLTTAGLYERATQSHTRNALLTWTYINSNNETNVVLSCRTTTLPGSIAIGTRGDAHNLQRVGIRTQPDTIDNNAHIHVLGNLRIDGDANNLNAKGTRIASRFFNILPNSEVSAFTVIGRATSGFVTLNVDGPNTPDSEITASVYCFVFTKTLGPSKTLIQNVGNGNIFLSAIQTSPGSESFVIKLKSTSTVSAEATVTWMGGGSGRTGGVGIE